MGRQILADQALSIAIMRGAECESRTACSTGHVRLTLPTHPGGGSFHHLIITIPHSYLIPFQSAKAAANSLSLLPSETSANHANQWTGKREGGAPQGARINIQSLSLYIYHRSRRRVLGPVGPRHNASDQV